MSYRCIYLTTPPPPFILSPLLLYPLRSSPSPWLDSHSAAWAQTIRQKDRQRQKGGISWHAKRVTRSTSHPSTTPSSPTLSVDSIHSLPIIHRPRSVVSFAGDYSYSVMPRFSLPGTVARDGHETTKERKWKIFWSCVVVLKSLIASKLWGDTLWRPADVVQVFARLGPHHLSLGESPSITACSERTLH